MDSKLLAQAFYINFFWHKHERRKKICKQRNNSSHRGYVEKTVIENRTGYLVLQVVKIVIFLKKSLM